jgi:transcriptional/translational regulatory protein YebC/TACO1
MFDQLGIIEYDNDDIKAEELFEAAVECGAENVESDGNWHEITCQVEDFSTVRDGLAEKYGDAEGAKLGWKAKEPVVLDLEQAEKITRFIDVLEYDDDVQSVTGGFEIPDEIVEQME